MTAKIDQKAYLQKYLGGSADKKKKKKKVSKGRGFKIIDDDIDLSKLRPLDGDELDVLGEGEDAPQIAGIIDERPEEVRKMEQFKTTSKWRVINQDDGFNSKLQIEEIKKNVKEVEKENELIFGKMYSDSEDEQKNDSDLSPPRKESKENRSKNGTTVKPQNHRDRDFSPPKKKDKKETKNSKNYDSDLSPPRKKESNSRARDSDSDMSPPRKNENVKSKEKVRKPSRWGDFKEEQRRAQRREAKEDSPPLYQRSSRSPVRKRPKNKEEPSDSDISPPRKTQNKKSYDSDLSPPRKKGKNRDDSDSSPPRKSKRDSKKRNRSSDSDLSPPRKKKNSPERQKDKDSRNKERYDDKYSRNRYNEDRFDRSDKRNPNSSSREYRSKDSNRRRNSSDESPRNDRNRDDKRRYNRNSDSPPPTNKKMERNDSNRRSERDQSPRTDRNRDDKRRYNRNSDSPPPTNKKMERTLEGKKAGLQDAVQLRQENEAFRQRENEAFNKMADDVSGRNAQVVSRKGKRETSEERMKQKEKASKQKELDEKYKKWSKGLKQIEDQEQRIQEFMHEASKPLARHKGDRDLEDRLKDVEREGDPMLKYIREKKRDRGDLGPEKPSYKGSYPPNRFNIRPGYRWDGVDRSNGYEKKFFDQQSKRKAQAEEAYKWSTEDL